MPTPIDELVKMHDTETLYELMSEDKEWLTQMEAAEGLVKLGDRRGYEFLVTAALSDDDEILEVAKEMLDSPDLIKMKNQIEAERESEQRAHIQSAKKRIQAGGKVYRYKIVYLPAAALMGDDPLGEGFKVPALDNQGLAGWEVVHVIANRRAILAGGVDEHLNGAHFLLKKEMLPSESAELDKE